MPSSPSAPTLFRVSFLHQGQIYEIYARQVSQAGLLGFIEVEEIVFGERTQVVVDPSEERLKKEFEGVKRTFIPMHSVLRVDEVDKEGTSRILPQDKSGTVTPFPVPVYGPRDPGKP